VCNDTLQQFNFKRAITFLKYINVYKFKKTEEEEIRKNKGRAKEVRKSEKGKKE
jgi:hypothetical protein